MDDLHGARAPELLPEESFEPIFPESPIQTATELPEVEVPALTSQDHFLRDQSIALADAPLSGDLPSTVPSDVLSTESRIAPTGEAPPTNDTKSVAQDENEPSAQEHVHVEPEVPFEVTDPLPIVKETSKQRRRREADEAIQREDEEIMQREEQDRLDQASFEQYRIDQERLEMARLEQKRLEREKARQERRRKEQLEQARLEKEQAEQDRLEAERREEERLEVESRERERLAREKIEQDRIAREALERERLENERLEAERLTDERLERERLERERLESERLEKERLEKRLRDRARIEQQILDNAKLERQRIEQERLDQERLHAQRLQEEAAESRRIEQQQIENEATEQARFDSEVKADSEAAEMARTNALEAEAARIAKEHEVQIQEFAEKIATGLNVEQTTSSSGPQQRAILDATTARVHVSTPHPETLPRPSPASRGVRTSNPVSRLPTPAASVGQTSSPHSVASDPPRSRAHAVEPPPQAAHAHRVEEPRLTSNGRNTSSSPALPAPRPQAVSQLIEENRPPAPSPPVARARPRHIPAFDSEDDSDSALVRPRRQFRGGEDPHDYRQPAHHRFASRVPAHEEPSVPSYSNPPPPQPPGYHPGYYPPTAPPHYQNHNYRVSQQGYPPPNPYGPPSHSSSSPYTEPWNYPPGYRHDSPPQRHDTLVTRDYPLGLAPIDTRSPLGADPGDVFSRISQAIPDLHVLLAQYKEAHGQLSVREDLLRRSAVEQEERLRVKDDEIADLKERNRSQEHRFSTEANRLRLQIGDLEEQARELHQQRIETDRVKREAYDTRSAFDAAMRSWEAKYKELEEAHAVLARTSAEKTTDFDEWKSNYTTRNDAEKIALAIHFDQRLKDADVLAETQRQEAAAAFVVEKDELRSEFQRKQLERQASFERVRNELETKLGAAQLDREESLRQERESREVWLAEREALIKAHEDDRENFHKGWDEQRDLLDAQYQKSKDESDKAWIELHADASRRADEEKARVDQLMQEKEELLRRYNALRAESEKEKAIIKSVATNLESEKSRLEKLMECYGDIAEIKSKGDSY
jgi:serine/arginine repetitive matrix protein 2